jgi:enoyl-CoA hydratase/carnithine racemase
MEIHLARQGRHVAIVTIDNQPRLNAMTRAMLAELGLLWDEIERDESYRAIVLTGAGTRAFTVGADISGDLSAGPEMAAWSTMRYSRLRPMRSRSSPRSTATASAADSS